MKIMNKTKEEIIYELFYNDENGCIDLSNLDFTKFNCSVKIYGMKVNGVLYQDHQTVNGRLCQDHQTVEGALDQYNQIVSGDLNQCHQTVTNGTLYQHGNTVCKDIFQDNQVAKGTIYGQGKIYE